jgi:hypothetical protein
VVHIEEFGVMREEGGAGEEGKEKKERERRKKRRKKNCEIERKVGQ